MPSRLGDFYDCVLAPVLGVVGLVCAGLIYLYVARQAEGTDLMREIASGYSGWGRYFFEARIQCDRYFYCGGVRAGVLGYQFADGRFFFWRRDLFAWCGFYRDEGGDQGKCEDGLCRQ